MGHVPPGTSPFGATLRRLRQGAGLTQEQLAELAKLSVNAVSALERGERRRPYPRTVQALVRALRLGEEDGAALVATATIDAGPPAAGPAGLPAPQQLPAVTRTFTGRAAELTRLDAVLADSAGPGPTIAVLHGTAGVGKTTLAVTWAQRVRDRFPDGQLYVDLRGYDREPPAEPSEVLEHLLRTMNVAADQIPEALSGRAALWRSVTAGRRLLIVLDNAGCEQQVRPLLPGCAGCVTLVTSRAGLAGLAVRDAASRIGLDVLAPTEAVALLRTVIGPERADADPKAVEALADLCARLPLALRVAGERTAADPNLSLSELSEQFLDEEQRLELLSAGSDPATAVCHVLSWSYSGLPVQPARLFRLLGVHPGAEVSVPAAAALAAVTPARARHLLECLAEAHLLEYARRERYRMHDLLRAYARKRAEQEGGTEVAGALRRIIGFYLYSAAATSDRLHPGRERDAADGAPPPEHPMTFDDFEQALRWCEAERVNLVAVTRLAARQGLPAAAWQLADCLWPFFYLRKYWTDWEMVCRVGLHAATTVADPRGELRMLNGLAAIRRDLQRFDAAIEHHHRF